MASHYPCPVEEARLDAQILDAIEDALPDSALLLPVEERLAGDELTAEARGEDEVYARELTERLQLFAERAEIELPALRALIAGEVKRRRTGRRRLPANEVPLELHVTIAAAKLAENTARGLLASAQIAFDAAVERRAIAEAVVRVYGADRREQG